MVGLRCNKIILSRYSREKFGAIARKKKGKTMHEDKGDTLGEKAVTRTVYLRSHLMVKGRFAKLILEGRKTTTIRLGRVIPRKEEVFIHGGGRVIAKARIKRVEYKKVSELTLEDARKDGYKSVKELLRELERVYEKEISPEDTVTIIEFEIIEKIDKSEPKDHYMGFTPRELAIIALKHLGDELSEEDKKALEALVRYGSIREAAIRLYGNIAKRWLVRRALRKSLRKLVEKKVIGGGKEGSCDKNSSSTRGES